MRLRFSAGPLPGLDEHQWLANMNQLAAASRESHDTAGDVVLADWTIRARRREDDSLMEWRGLSVCELREGKITWWREHHLAPPAPIAG